MTKVLESSGQDKTINIITLKDPAGGNVPAICVRIDKKEEKLPVASQKHDDDNVLAPSTLATCRKKYPTGCTILECRLDALNKPVAHVLQMPGDSNAISPKMSVIVEATQTPTGPYSRVTSCPIKEMYDVPSDQECSKKIGTPRKYAQESGETSNNESNKEGLVPQILCNAIVEEPSELAERYQGTQETPEISYVECNPSEANRLRDNVVKPQELIYRSPPNCEDTCPGTRRHPRPWEDTNQASLSNERRNGLDPTDSECMLRYTQDRPMLKRDRVCPASCCQPIVIKAQETPKPSINPKTPKPTPVVSRKCSKDIFSPSPSQDSLERYKDYVSPSQLEKYRTCRSKRNGLQDECYLPLPRHLQQTEKLE